MCSVQCPWSDVHCLMSTVGCPRSDVHCPMSTVRCPSPDVHCPMSIVQYPLSNVNCPMSTVHCLLSTFHCVLYTVGRPTTHLCISQCLKRHWLVAFLAALSSSRSLVVRPSVRWSVGGLCEKVTFRVLNCNLNLPTYLPMRQ